MLGKSLLWVAFLSLCTIFCFAQSEVSCATDLVKEPYFVKNKVSQNDSLYLNDLAILKKCGNFSDTDSLLFKGSIFLAIMDKELEDTSNVTYERVINAINQFKKTNTYKEFLESVTLYKSLESKTVNPKNWETDKILFVRLGFTEADLEDFKIFIADEKHQKLTYKQAYILYMKEIDALEVKQN